jgi:hypothetical protein
LHSLEHLPAPPSAHAIGEGVSQRVGNIAIHYSREPWVSLVPYQLTNALTNIRVTIATPRLGPKGNELGQVPGHYPLGREDHELQQQPCKEDTEGQA